MRRLAELTAGALLGAGLALLTRREPEPPPPVDSVYVTAHGD